MVALVAAAVLRVGGRVIHTPAAVALAAAAFLLIVAGLPFPVIIAAAAAIGFAAGRANSELLGRRRGPRAEADQDAGPPDTSRLGRRLVRALVIWLVPVAALLLVGGVIGDLAGFFTLAALVTFGGAYAVLPFVASQAVNHYGWLTSKDMVAGLALGESTPGPLIMVNTFVGFLAGYHVEGGLGWGLVGRDDRHPGHVRAQLRLHHHRRADHRPDPGRRQLRQRPERDHDRGCGGDRRPGGVRGPACAGHTTAAPTGCCRRWRWRRSSPCGATGSASSRSC